MWMVELPPFVPFFVGAFLALITRGRLQAIIMLAVPVLGGIHLWMVPEGIHWQFAFLDFELIPYRADRLSLLFGYVFHIAAFITIIYALHVRDTVQQVSCLLYAGSALGVVFAGDLLTVFVFWELLALTSVFLIWARRTPRAYISGMRYLIIQVLSGVLLLAGAIFYFNEHGTLGFEYIGLEGICGWLIFIAVGIKCGFPLLHNWLTDAYPEATPVGTVFLSAFTTKVAIYMLARAYPGTELLLYIGAVMVCFPIFFAVIENNLRRVLCYLLVNQLGFMVIGVGIGTELALNGTAAHAFAHIIYKGLLFMALGAILHMTGRSNGSDLGGLFKSMPITASLYMIGAASIAFPLFSGFVSKSMIMSAALYEGHNWIWLVLLLGSAAVFLQAGIKIPYVAFFGHDAGIRTTEPPKNMLVAMAISATLCIAVGVYPEALYSLLPFETDYAPYDTTHVLAQLQLMFFAALAFVWLKRRGLYPPELPSVNLDIEWFYRRGVPRLLQSSLGFVGHQIDRIDSVVRDKLAALPDASEPFVHLFFSRVRLTGTMVVQVAFLLAMFLVIAFIQG